MTKKAWKCEGIKPTDKYVLLALAETANSKTGKCFPSITTIANMTGLCRRQVMRAVKSLEESGVISRKVGVGSSTHYTLLVTHSHQCHTVTSDTQSPSSDTQSPALVTHSHPNLEVNLEVTKREGAKRFAPPTRQDVEDYMLEKKADFEQARSWSEDFFDFYESKGWVVGKTKMKSWKHAASRWTKQNLEKRNENTQRTNGKYAPDPLNNPYF